MKWLKEIELQGEIIRLEPLRIGHKEALNAAAKDGDLYNLWFTSVPQPEKMEAFIATALDGYEKDLSLPFVVRELSSGRLVGSTRYLNADSTNKRLEIGHTWYAKSWQGTRVNKECKLLLFEHAFETLECIAVEFRTNFHNWPSRRAIESLGAKRDGVLRNHRIDAQGLLRDTVVYSVINQEWPTVKFSLQHRLNR
jgi:RimJ/RimL family protein N-acetyltransferase